MDKSELKGLIESRCRDVKVWFLEQAEWLLLKTAGDQAFGAIRLNQKPLVTLYVDTQTGHPLDSLLRLNGIRVDSRIKEDYIDNKIDVEDDAYVIPSIIDYAVSLGIVKTGSRVRSLED
ncbi:hypothetical protein NZD89_08540 [Alicyclobacillus fastidiosus]|uniref:Uncharacterized protein n=1 Tax=Alicyclobacillus fastidiosus TaxID=392011 RepID=A0ABY6ZKQ3_9BACL|nr:hypothetical protein [Alicyclobacillus fastidiosus]WAH43419.1 hypothetical protein NZD89_08540 [Alicyclobacillus fastidiosus]GMA59566.1 hypothetical protein GCM10025859_00060 [Alicyclobacillus fastidiosus]GMA65493.1 hypothetical protein GCM10025859_59330 [Alicyclobacillus fastidiosus]